MAGKLFQKGKSGNPSGRPKIVTEIRAAAQKHGLAAFNRILELSESEDERVALAASQEILNRGYGKPAQTIEATVTHRDITEWTRAELITFLNDAADRSNGTVAEDGRGGKPDSVH